jgi:hypothetical protein
MEELVALVSKKTGLNKEQATMAVTTVLNFVKSKLPPPIAAQVDGVLSGSSPLGAASHALDDGKIDMNDAANLLGGLLGGKK